MPPKAKIAAPIDRPLSKAYVRQFTGWSTATPPGLSDPTSFRVMENVQINRDGSCRVRPGLRYLSYDQAPDGSTISVDASSLPINYGEDWLYTIAPSYDLAMMQAGYDDSAWVTAPAPFGSDPSSATIISTAAPVGLVTRRWFISEGGDLHFYSSGFDDHMRVHIDGVEVFNELSYDAPNSVFSPGPLDEIVSGIPAGLHLLAVYNTSDIAGANNGWDLTVTEPTGTGSGLDVALDGVGTDRPLVGTLEPFYLNDGTKGHLVAVRETDGTVGFRVMVLDVNASAMYALDHPLIDFEIRQPLEVLNFSADTTYVKYLQIDNKIFALSDNGENMRVFSVGVHKEAKALAAIERPEWDNEDKLDVVHPDAAWINDGEPNGKRRNRIPNPSFENSLKFWNKGDTTEWHRPATPAVTPVSGERMLKLTSKPQRTNLVRQPLHDVAAYGVTGWDPVGAWIGSGGVQQLFEPTITPDGTFMKVTLPAKRDTFYARSDMFTGIEAHEQYRVAFDPDQGADVTQVCKIRFHGITGTKVGEDVDFTLPAGSTRWISGKFTAPKGAVSARLFIGGENQQTNATHVRAKNIVFCLAGEGTAMFHGGSGANYFWRGQINNSASVYHPPADVRVWTDKVPARPTKAHSGSIYVQAETATRNVTFELQMYNKDSELLETFTTTLADTAGAPLRIDAGSAGVHAKATQARIRLTIPAVPYGEVHWIDAAMIEAGTAVPDTYFDGSTTDVPTAQHSWKGKRHESGSLLEEFLVGATIPPAETRTPNTLLSDGGRAVNVYSFGFFYTFENEVGESAASKIKVVRAQRAWSDWAWETPNAAGEPSGTETNKPDRAADQLVAIIPEEVFDEAIAQGATEWNLYMFTWSDQEPVPVTAMRVGNKQLPADALYDRDGWLRVTPLMVDAGDVAILPTLDNRYNFSDPSRGGQGLVVSDRMVMVNDPTAAAVIRWSSNKMGEYTNFTASQGGGYKTLTSGNLYVPAAVKLWQNPQSADTICILCLGTDGESVSYYMAPAQVASQSEAVNVMGFEETTGTPGTTSPYGVEVFNNSLYHPLDDQLMKTTASNYNLNHKSQTDQIRNMWERLATKYWIMSSQHDNRLYYIVNNPDGEQVQDGCKGNEVWVFDAAAKTGTWSRFLIQGHALRKIEFGGQIYMSVIRPDGVYILDPSYGMDDVVEEGTKFVTSQPIPWKFEFNTQGANRAHDAWCHLQQAQINLGFFQGRMRYGLRGVDLNGRVVEMSKVVKDEAPPDRLAFDIEDQLLIRRDLKEWFFFAESLPDEPSYGQVSLVQYRYAPISVNVGYEFGSIETFEYGRDVALAASSTTDNGIPLPYLDSRRP